MARLVRNQVGAFTLMEVLISMVILALLVSITSRMFTGAATVTSVGNKRMDSDNQGRLVLDRMAVDFLQMLKRNDTDFFGKNTAAPNTLDPGMSGGATGKNDQIAFFSTVPGYYPPSGSKSPLSLVAYRVNSKSTSPNPNYNKLVRIGRGLVWNGVSATDTPMVFFPLTIGVNWPNATDPSTTDTGYEEVVGADVFRFEYYYQLQNGVFSDTPWDTSQGHNSVSGLRDVGAFVVTIATMDPKSRVLLTETQLANLAGKLPDSGYTTPYDPGSGNFPAELQSKWQDAVNTQISNASSGFPKAALQGVRFYERYFYLNGRQH